MGLQSAWDLLRKLDWELQEMTRVHAADVHGGRTSHGEVGAYRAFNAAVTAWHICDWVWQTAPRELRERLKTDSPEPAAADAGPLMALVLAECREIRICQQLGTGAKHFEVKRRNDPDIVTSFEEAMHLVEFGSGEEKETVFLQGKAVFVKDGTQSYSDLGLFSRALAYWNGFFERYGVQ